jgi:SAM-dependent methyltransferase
MPLKAVVVTRRYVETILSRVTGQPSVATLQAKLDHRAQRIRDAKATIKALQRELDATRGQKQIEDLEGLVMRALTDFRGFCLLPPEELRLHVGTVSSAANFWQQGARSSKCVLEFFGEAPEGPVLDWGCGSGRTINWLSGRGTWSAQYRGCDVDAEAIAWLREQGIANVEVCGDAPPLPYPDNHFAGIFSSSLLTHIPPDRHRQWYAEIARILRPGARAFLTVSGLDGLTARRALSETERHSLDRNGWSFTERSGHYKHAAVVTEEFVRREAGLALEMELFQPLGYAPCDVAIVRKAPR